MMRTILLLCALLFGNLFAESWEGDGDEQILHSEQRAVFVSLGSHCEVAVQLKEHHLRIASFPFDWLLSTIHNGLIALLDDHFLHFIDENHLIQHPIYPHLILNSRYYIEFRHTWPFTDFWCDAPRHRYQLNEIQTKFKRRITRFEQLADHPGKVYFIRVAFDLQNDPNPFWGKENISTISAAQAEELRNALSRFFPNLDFKLIIINYKEDNTPPILGLDRVFEFKVRRSNRTQDYGNLLRTLSIF